MSRPEETIWACVTCMTSDQHDEDVRQEGSGEPAPWAQMRDTHVTMGMMANEHWEECQTFLRSLPSTFTAEELAAGTVKIPKAPGTVHSPAAWINGYSCGLVDGSPSGVDDLRDGTESLPFDKGYERALHDLRVCAAKSADDEDCSCEHDTFYTGGCGGCGSTLYGEFWAYTYWS